MHRLVLGALGGAALVVGGVAVAAAQHRNGVVEQAQVPGRAGSERTIQLLRSGKNLETVSCRDFAMLDESFKPEAIRYAANYGPKGKAHPTETVAGIESIQPMVVASCRARPGDHFTTAVHTAMMQR